MDALISNSSKSYYACVGESTHAYQSPSKDLNAINNRLNGYAFLTATSKIQDYFFFALYNRCFYTILFSNRKARGILNLDNDVGLVSDSMVANSLCLQNGKCAPTPGATLKCEQPDS